MITEKQLSDFIKKVSPLDELFVDRVTRKPIPVLEQAEEYYRLKDSSKGCQHDWGWFGDIVINSSGRICGDNYGRIKLKCNNPACKFFKFVSLKIVECGSSEKKQTPYNLIDAICDRDDKVPITDKERKILMRLVLPSKKRGVSSGVRGVVKEEKK